MEEALIAQLLASSGVTALVGAAVRPNVRAQNDNPPCVVVTTISRSPVYHSGGQADLAEAMVQMDCWGKTALEALTLARAVKAAIPKQRFNRNSVAFGGIFQLGERHGFEGDTPSARLHRVSIDFRVWHTSP